MDYQAFFIFFWCLFTIISFAANSWCLNATLAGRPPDTSASLSRCQPLPFSAIFASPPLRRRAAMIISPAIRQPLLQPPYYFCHILILRHFILAFILYRHLFSLLADFIDWILIIARHAIDLAMPPFSAIISSMLSFLYAFSRHFITPTFSLDYWC